MLKQKNNLNPIDFSKIAPVIETDLNCAIKAISQKEYNGIDTIKKHQQNRDEVDTSINAARNSIINNLKQITKPVSVEEYNEYLCDSGSESCISSDDDDSDSEDEERLLDEDAFHRAKSLRADVRNSIQRIIALRNEVPKLAVNLTLENIRRHEKQINSIPLSSKLNTDDLNIETRSEKDVSTMHQSLLELSQTLQSLEKTLPEKYDGLHETSDIIESTLKKYLAVKKGDASVLSGVERAMISESNDGRMERKKEELDGKENCTNGILSPGTRLTRFMFS